MFPFSNTCKRAKKSMNKQETQRKICSVVWPYHLRRTMKALHSDHPFWEIHCIDYFPIFPPSCWDNDEINTEYPWLFTRNKACKAQDSHRSHLSWWLHGGGRVAWMRFKTDWKYLTFRWLLAKLLCLSYLPMLITLSWVAYSQKIMNHHGSLCFLHIHL